MKIQRIAKEVGGVVALSRILGLSRGAVSQWDVVPVDRVLDVCRAVAWQVTPHQLRPDIYPNPTDGIPPNVTTQQQEAA